MNRVNREEIKHNKEIEAIYQELVEKPYLLDFMQKCITLTDEQRNAVLVLLQGNATVSA